MAIKSEPVEESAKPPGQEGVQSLVNTAEKEFQRKDTSQLQAGYNLFHISKFDNIYHDKLWHALQDDHAMANHPDAVRMEDGSLRFKHKDKLETWKEREERLEHNRYMRFSRTFESASSLNITW